MSESVRVSIFRYDPKEADGPRYQQYDLPLSESLTVIRALFYLSAHSDDPPAFRRFTCNRGQCAGCVMTINGRTRRACTTRVNHGMVLEPLYDYPVIKDLVVDFGTKTEMPDGGYMAVRTGSVVIQSDFPQSKSPGGPWVHLSIDSELCLACAEKPCVRACWVNRIGNLEDRSGLRLEPYSAPIRVQGGKAVLAGLCLNCEDKPCVAKCPAQAFQKTAQGAAMRINPKQCIGCGLCVSACRGGRIWLNLERGSAVKCDLCGGKPECVAACPCGAIHFEIIKR